MSRREVKTNKKTIPPPLNPHCRTLHAPVLFSPS